MRYLAIVGLVALLAAPVMAQTPVTITVDPYAAVVVPPDALVMTAGVPGGAGPTASAEFRVQGNTGFTVSVAANEVSPSVEVVAGQLGGLGFPYPTARIGGPGGAGSAIGYGVAVTGELSRAWGLEGPGDLTGIIITSTAGLKICNITVNSYVSGGRIEAGGVLGQSGVLAPPGDYRGTLTVTVALPV